MGGMTLVIGGSFVSKALHHSRTCSLDIGQGSHPESSGFSDFILDAVISARRHRQRHAGVLRGTVSEISGARPLRDGLCAQVRKSALTQRESVHEYLRVPRLRVRQEA